MSIRKMVWSELQFWTRQESEPDFEIATLRTSDIFKTSLSVKRVRIAKAGRVWIWLPNGPQELETRVLRLIG